MSDLTPFPSGASLSYGDPGSPLVVLLHDWYGRLPWLLPYAEGLARRGFRVVVPDLFNGETTTDPAEAAHLLGALDLRTALAHIDDTILMAREQGSPRVGVIGFSMGGWLTLLHAQGGSADAVVAYYASLRASEQGLIPCPVLLQLAEVDEWAETEDPDSFVDRAKDHGTPITQFTYSGTRHSFANADLPDRVDTRAAALAFARTVSFLEEYLLD
ncbi:MAG: dienelactone hydrolase family protein [Terrimesophilobacter sp.]